MLEALQDHSLTILLALATCISFAWLLRVGRRIGLNAPGAALVAVLHTVLGVLSVMAFAIIEGFGDLSVVGNMSLFGGVFFMPLYYLAVAKITKSPIADVFDVLTVPLVLTLMLARINCIISGCCLGAMIEGTDLRWPTREIEIVFYLAFLAIVGRRVLQGVTHGEAFPLYMISYGVFRFICEFFRYSVTAMGPFHVSHIWALITFTLGVSILMELRSRQNAKRGKATVHKKTTQKGKAKR